MPIDPELKRTETVATRFTPEERTVVEYVASNSGGIPMSDVVRLAVRLLGANVIALRSTVTEYLRRFQLVKGDGSIERCLILLSLRALQHGGNDLAVKAVHFEVSTHNYWAWAISEGSMVRFGIVKATTPDETLKKSLGCPLTISGIDFAEWLGQEELGVEFTFGTYL